ncbi:MAG: LuxR C-terminal-related transcriptional regulator [Candidatus Acidiferrum sp.]
MKSKLAGTPSDSYAIQSTPDEVRLLPVLLPTANVGVATIDRDFRYRAINETLASANGLPVEAHIGRTIRQILGPAAAEVEPVFRHVFGTGESRIYEVAAKIRTRTTMGHWIMTCIPVKDADDRVSRVCAIVIEITKKKTLEDFLFHLAGKLLFLREATTKKRLPMLKKDQRTQWVDLLEQCTGDVIEALNSLRPSVSSNLLKPAGDLDSPVSRESPATLPPLQKLSRRERQVLQLLASNKNNKEVAVGLGISVRTAEAHRRRLMEKLGLHSVSEMIHLAIRHGIVEA